MSPSVEPETPRPEEVVPEKASTTEIGGTPTKSARALILGYLVLALTTFGGQILGLIGLALVARHVGADALGAYAFAATLAGYFALPLMPGLSMLGVRELAIDDGGARRRIVNETQGLLILNGSVAFGILVALAGVLGPSHLATTLIPIMGLTLIINAAGLDWAMQGLQRVERVGFYRLAGQAAYFVALLLVLNDGPDGVRNYAWCNIFGLAVTAALTGIHVRRRLRDNPRSTGTDRPFRSRSRVEATIRRSVPVGTSLMMVQIYYSADLVLLGYLGTSADVGRYSVAGRLPLALTAIAALWVQTFYPHAAQLHERDRGLLRHQVGTFATLAAFVVVPLVPLSGLLGGDAMAALFGSEFRSAGWAFAGLMGFASVALVNANVGQVLLAGGHDRDFLGIVTLGAVLNIVLNLLLIPPFGITGAAVATVIAEMATLFAAGLRVTHLIGPLPIAVGRLVGAGVVTVAATALAAAAHMVVPWWIAGLLGYAIYGVLIVATRIVRVADLRAARTVDV